MTTINHFYKGFLLTSALVLSLGLALNANAHTDEYLDTVAAPHGGQLRMAGASHFELVVKNNELTIYLTDHAGTHIASAGASGTATILSSKGKATVQLSPAGDNVLSGKGKFEAVPDMKIIVSITQAGQSAQQARFTPLKKSAVAVDKPAKPSH